MQTGYQHPDMVVHRYPRQVVFTSRGSGWIPGACTAETGYRHKVPVLLSTEDVALRRVTDVNSSFIPIELRQRNTPEASVPFLVIVRGSYLPISASWCSPPVILNVVSEYLQ